jgi:hypothetical protein
MSAKPFIVLEHGLRAALRKSGRSEQAVATIVLNECVQTWLREVADTLNEPAEAETLKASIDSAETPAFAISSEYACQCNECRLSRGAL